MNETSTSPFLKIKVPVMLFVKVFNVIAGNVIFLLIVDSWKCLELFKQETNTRFYKTFSTESADKNKKTHHTITYFDCVKQIWSSALALSVHDSLICQLVPLVRYDAFEKTGK